MCTQLAQRVYAFMEWLAHQPEEEIVVSESRSRRIDTKQKEQRKAKQCPSHKLRFCLRRHRPVAHTRAALRLSVLAWSSRARRTHSAWLFLAFNSVLKCEDPSLRAAAWADHASCEQSVDGRRARRARALQPSEYSVGECGGCAYAPRPRSAARWFLNGEMRSVDLRFYPGQQ